MIKDFLMIVFVEDGYPLDGWYWIPFAINILCVINTLTCTLAISFLWAIGNLLIVLIFAWVGLNHLSYKYLKKPLYQILMGTE